MSNHKLSVDALLHLLKKRIRHHTNQEPTMILIQGGIHEGYLQAIEHLKDNRTAVVTVSGQERDLYRIPYWDIEFNIDWDTGKIGVTGDETTIVDFMGDN